MNLPYPLGIMKNIRPRPRHDELIRLRLMAKPMPKQQQKKLGLDLITSVVYTAEKTSDILKRETVLLGAYLLSNDVPVTLMESRLTENMSFKNEEVYYQCLAMLREHGKKRTAIRQMHHLAVGNIIAYHANNVVSSLEVNVINESLDEDVCSNIIRVLKMVSRQCQFNKTNDFYIHSIVRGRLHPGRQSLLTMVPYNPMLMAVEEFGQDTNAIVQHYINADVYQVCNTVDWKHEGHPELYALTITIFMEVIDELKEFGLLSNTEIPYALVGENKGFPFPVTLTSSFQENELYGYIYKEVIHVAGPDLEYPVINMVIALLEQIKASCPWAKGTSDMLAALDGFVQETNPFNRYTASAVLEEELAVAAIEAAREAAASAAEEAEERAAEA